MIEKSLQLSNKLEECKDIATLYAKQVDSVGEKVHYTEIAKAIATIKRIHVGTRQVLAIDVIPHERDEDPNRRTINSNKEEIEKIVKRHLTAFGLKPSEVDSVSVNSWEYIDGVLHAEASVKMLPKCETVTVQIMRI